MTTAHLCMMLTLGASGLFFAAAVILAAKELIEGAGRHE